MTKTYELPKEGCLGSRRLVAEFDENGIAKITEQALDSLICELNEYAERKTEPKWIPVSERLPEENKQVLIQYRTRYRDDVNLFDVTSRSDYNYWQGIGREIDVIAWMPLPEPYKAESEEV